MLTLAQREVVLLPLDAVYGSCHLLQQDINCAPYRPNIEQERLCMNPEKASGDCSGLWRCRPRPSLMHLSLLPADIALVGRSASAPANRYPRHSIIRWMVA